MRRFEDLCDGGLQVRESGLTTRFGERAGPRADLEVVDPRFWTALVRGGDLGAAEAYMDGWWDSHDLAVLVRLMARNRDVMLGLSGTLATLHGWGAKLYHWGRDNTRIGSRRNIEEHYDLSNDFFALFLDESMTYSCALFETPEATLLEAQVAKIDRLCRKLQLKESDHLLEIGTGWGGLAIHAASVYGCRVTTTTISSEQHAEACRRVRAAGLEGQIEVLLKDYRDLEGRYDKIVSVEMIEAVGHRWVPKFFAACSQLLWADGLMALQAITIADRNYEAARDRVDFIQRYIFPGGAIPSVASLSQAVARASELTPLHTEDLGLHYARTLRLWRQSFEAHRDEILALGFSPRFLRCWRYYFCYCEGGFRERVIGNVQMLLAGPKFRGETLLGRLP